jgi:hypothetical protein
MLTPARKAELNERTREEDRFQVSRTIYFSTFVLFNLSLASLYFIFKNESVRKTIKVPIFFVTFSLVSYKLSVEWPNREFLRQM